MKTLKEIKLKIANELSYEDSADLLMEGFNSSLGNKEKFVDLVAKEYAKQMCIEQKQLCYVDYNNDKNVMDTPLATDNK